MNIAVVISTYNGEKYLREQLDSILAQVDVDVSIFVRDDGSTDGTRDILIEYANMYDNISVDFAENVGVGNSFMNALYSTPNSYDYYAFADQDDIWHENKLIEAIKLLQSCGKSLYTSNQECVDKDGISMALRYGTNAKIHLTPTEIMISNTVAGCTMVFGNAFYKILTDTQNRPSTELLYNRIHDVWVAFVASLHDGIIYDERSFIKYRQHENNVVGVKVHKGEKLKKLKNRKLRNGRSAIAREACDKFPELAEKHRLVVLSASAKSFSSKVALIKARRDVCSISGESVFGYGIKVLCGLY